jgi:hypothetical protein
MQICYYANWSKEAEKRNTETEKGGYDYTNIRLYDYMIGLGEGENALSQSRKEGMFVEKE